MNRFIPTLYVRLKGARGWQRNWFNEIDASKVVSFDTRRRLFCIFDRDKPIELSLKYKAPGYETDIAPAVTFGNNANVGAAFYDKYNPNRTEYLYLRYESEEHALLDVKEIDKARYKLEKYMYDQETRFNKEINNII